VEQTQRDASPNSSPDSSPSSGDIAVERYLEFLANPESARDAVAIAQAEADVSSASDVIARLKALSALERASKVDGSDLRAAFIKHARMWATVNRVTVSAFQTLGVPAVVLAESGFDLGHGSINDAKRKNKTAPNSSGIRKTNVGVAAIKEWATSQTASFSLADVMTGAGGSLMTVRKAITELVEGGALRSLGQVAAPGVRGRAPERFERA
jgi:hypothetical protein